MAVVKVGEKALAKVNHDFLFKKPTSSTIKRRQVLDEDTYSQDVENIIQRDFYPDLSKLKAQTEFLDAVGRNDVLKLRELQMKYGSTRHRTSTSPSALYNTPETFETPDIEVGRKESAAEDSRSVKDDEEIKKNNNKQRVSVCLDDYLQKNTSEDNASFDELMQEAERRHRIKYSWLYEKEDQYALEHAEKIKLPSIEQQADEKQQPAAVTTWNYLLKNSLMYIPDGVDLSAKEKIEDKKPPRIIVHPNTRFMCNPFNQEINRQALAEAAHVQALAKEGKVGIDGKEIVHPDTPKVNGYGFVATPSPAPGVDASPIMTWGEIEGTPFRLDGGDTPLSKTPGPSFRIPDTPARDRLALTLAESVCKKHTAAKQDALKTVTANLVSPSLRLGSQSHLDRLSVMSPAAQRLASTKLGVRLGTDKALRASYTPSPQRKSFQDKSPLLRSTPSRISQSKTPKKIAQEAISLTDNLLNLPKRSKAADFFEGKA